jgi:glycine C-acetyltransferase
MDGDIARLDEITRLAQQYDALVMVDDCHATGFLGPNGRGSGEHHGVMDRIDITTSTLGKALGGGSGGYTTGRQEIIDLLRQRSRPYLFSNTLPPPLVAAAIRVFELLDDGAGLRSKLMDNTRWFRAAMMDAGFDIKPGEHPIVPVMLYDAPLAQRFAARLIEEGIYAIGFFYPVVPQGEARIRVQLSAAHEREHLERAVAAFTTVGRELGVIS